MDSLISSALYLHEQLLMFDKKGYADECIGVCGKSSILEAKVSRMLLVSSNLNRIILAKKNNRPVHVGRIVIPEYNLENLGLSAETIKFLRQPALIDKNQVQCR